jgi:ABC-type multidrug transport system fused ATPase/permease subunit
VSLGVARLTVAGVSTFGALAVLMLVNWVLGLSVGLVLALGLGAGLLLGARLQGRVKEARRRQSYLAANMNDKIASMAVVQVFGQARRERRRVRRQGQLLKRAMVARAWVAGGLRALSESTGAIATGTALLVGAFEVASGRATPGTVVAAMAIVGVLLPQLRDLGRVYEYYQGARVSRDKVQQFLQTPSLVEEYPHASGLRPGPGRLEFHRVSVAGSLKRFSAVAEAGSVVAVVGPNGAGKSTLLALAARLLDPEHGRVRLDGRNTARRRLSSLRRAIGMVSPDLPLLRGTVEMNLRYRWPDAPAQAVAEVAALCGVDEILAELPEGGNTRLVDGGLNLSPGQRQRIALARALLGGPRLLLLDEADASLDPRAAEVLQRVLTGYQGTVLLVTHRPDRLASADAIWYLEAGRLVESGSPADLVRGGGPTAQLFGPRLALAS